MKLKAVLFCMTALAGSLAAQAPVVNAGGIINAASAAFAGLPSSAIAQGSIFSIYGSNLGPTPYAQASTYPIPTTLGGTSVRVTSGSTSAQAYIFVAASGQINAMLPSNIPAGTASLTVTTSAGTSAPQTFQVASNSFGVFAMNSAGSGPGVITNPDGKPFGLITAANPDDPAVIWGTGLAPVTGNEAGGALPGDQTSVPVEVWVGATKATVTYRGRSGCCAGLDQIVFTTPNVLGCRVPVVVKINNVVSNSTTMAIAAKGGRTCSDPNASAADVAKYARNGLSVGVVSLSRIGTSLTVPFLGDITTNADVGSATFTRYTPAQLDASANPLNTIQTGACTVQYFKGSSAPSVDPLLPKTLDAGSAISVNGAAGTKSLTKTSVAGITSYSAALSDLSGGLSSTGYLEPGNFTVSGPGGPDVGGFSSSIAVTSSLNWTNKNAITDVTRANGQVVNWTGADPAGTVMIIGTSTTSGTAPVGASFTCYAKGSDNSFTIPNTVLLQMPVSAVVSGVPTGSLMVGTYNTPKTFSATGLDAGYLVYTNLSLKTLNYK